MALIQCPKCGNEISDKAVQCPYCGTYQEEQNKKLDEFLCNKKKMIISCAILILCIIVTFFMWIKASEKRERVKNVKKIERAAELLGKEVVDGSVDCSADFAEFASDVWLFGYEGEFSHSLSGDETDKVNCMTWTSKNWSYETDVEKIVDQLCRLYGKYDRNNKEYMDIENSYQWENVDKYSWVVCGIDRNDKIEIIWIK